jgi:hypothetical protein
MKRSGDGDEDRIWEEMEAAQSAYMQAVSEQNTAIDNLPTGTAGDGIFDIERAAKVRREAFARLKEATAALHAFLNRCN